MKTYKITVTDTATYTISAETLEDAENLAVEWFSEREPSIKSEETDESAEYKIEADEYESKGESTKLIPRKDKDICEKCIHVEETDGSNCYECVKGESKFEKAESEVLDAGRD